MAKDLVYGSVDPSSILAPLIDFLFFSLILWKFSKLEAGFGYITPLIYIYIYNSRTAVPFMWGSLRLAPIIRAQCLKSTYRRLWRQGDPWTVKSECYACLVA